MILARSPSDIQVLLLEDDPADAALVRQALQRSGLPLVIRQVDLKEDYLRALEALRPDLILADHALPAFRNAEALKLARQRYPDIPFIFVSGSVGEERAVETIKEGATDYVLKDHLARLGPAVRRALDEAAQRREKEQAEETLRLILENSLDAVVAMDRDGLVTAWNAPAERMFGWPAVEALGRPLADLIIPERLRAAHQKGLRRYFETGQGPILGRRVEMPALYRDGREFPVELTVTPIVQESGTTFSAFIRDLSAVRRQGDRLGLEHAVSRILAEAGDATGALRAILEALGRGLGWEVARYWRVDAGTPVLTHAWTSDPEAFADAVDPGRTPAPPGAPGPGLRGAFSFEIRDGADVLGLIDLSSPREQSADPELRDVLGAVGRQIGQFLRRKQGEASSRWAEQQLLLFADALPTLIGFVGRDLRYGMVNRAYEGWFGLSAPEIRGKPVWEVLGEKAWQTIRPYAERALAGERQRFEIFVPFRAGARWMDVTYVPNLKPDGKLDGFFVLATDITARRKSEESTAFLSEATSLLASSLDTETTLSNLARLAVPRIADWCAIFLKTNGGSRPLTVVHKDPSKAQEVQDLIQKYPLPEDYPHGYSAALRTGQAELLPVVTDEMLGAAATDEKHLGRLRALGLKSGMTVPLVVGGAPVGALTLASSESGRVYGQEDLAFALELGRRAALAIENARLYEEVRHESDERKLALEAVRDLNEHLEQRVQERTARLEDITRELEAFASTVAHDLRSPLRIMRGFSSMLLEDYSGKLLDATGQEYARRIDLASERMSGLVEDLLSYSRLAREDVPIHTVDLDDAVAQVLRDMSDELAAAKADVTVEGPLPRVQGHGGLLAQVLGNLLGNAVKFVAPGEIPRVRIRAVAEDARVRLWIEDQGIGIDAAHLEKIFNVFERLHPQDRYPGTGLGLAIVRRAVERMAGTVGVESEPGKGSRFWIRLRAAPGSFISP